MTDTEPRGTRLSVFGLGYVGIVSTACFAHRGHQVIGVDPDTAKVDAVNRGTSPIVEAKLPELLSEGVSEGRIRATSDVVEAIRDSDLSLICVGTPSAPDGSCDLGYLREASAQIGDALRIKEDYHVIVFRSTIPPGTTRKVLLPIIEEHSGKRAGTDFGLCFHPEFLRESTAIDDFFSPPKTVVGSVDGKSGETLGRLYEGIDEGVIYTSIEVAEMVKYVDNTWHALKVSFANEIGKISKASDIDSHAVMDIFVQDTKLNISPYYLKPGYAFGGSCLPKDVRSMTHLAKNLGIETPVLNSIIGSNQAQIGHALSLIEGAGRGSVGFLGVTFKADTDDLRESPVLPLIAALVGKGYDVKIYDPNLDLDSSLRHHMLHSRHATDDVGKLMARLPELVVDTVEEACSDVDTIVVAHSTPRFRKAAAARQDNQKVVDLVRLFGADGERERIFAAGMNDYLQKPANRDRLLEKLERWGSGGGNPGLRVLLAEDDPVMRKVVKAIVEKAGHKLDTAANGSEAVEAVRGTTYDLVFMDLSMPGMDGFEATQAIRSMSDAKRLTPIVALSALAVPEKSETYSGICW